MFWLLISIALACGLIPPHEARILQGNATDLQALISFKAAISNDPHGALSTWNETNTTLHFCDWFGVTCDAPLHPERVTALSLDSLKLNGTLSPHLANLTFLRLLNLSNNNFHGHIPSHIGGLSRLRYLSLSYNFLEGEISLSFGHSSKLSFINLRSNNLAGQIPANFSRCLSLQRIFLDDNQLSGTIPASLTSLPNLQLLGLEQNQLTGRIPSSLGNATSLFALDLGGNSFQGNIPDDLGRLTSLEFIGLGMNRLSGKIPASLLNISSIYYFNVGGNNLYGVLPHEIGNTLPSLQTFSVFRNQFSGPFPASLSNASGLQEIDFLDNKLVGTIPESLGSLPYLNMLSVARNELEAKGARDWGFLASLSNCSYLTHLELSYNNLGGPLPGSVANLSSQLIWLGMTFNQISGTIPAGIGRYNKLTAIGMSNNLLTGTIPSTVGMLPNLNVLYLNGNKLNGKIPTTIGNLTQLNVLELGDNSLQGNIPASTEKLINLNALSLAGNMLSGIIPGQVLNQLSSLSLVNLSNNLFSGPLPSQISSLINVNYLDVSYNRLSREIPGSIGSCQTLVQLFMQGNFFKGPVPSALSGLKGIQELDLSRNNLSGPFPRFFETCPLLYHLNLSFNDLEGQVPQGGAFGNASAISVIGNTKLCGGIKELHLWPCHSIVGMTSRRSSLKPKIVVPLIVVSIIVFCFSAAYCIRKRRRRITNPLTSLPNEPFARVSYEEIHRATDGFSSSNLIGAGSSGSVYKGVMDSDPNKIVAIKVLNLEQRGAERSFVAECDSLKVIRHRNVLSIVTVCSSTDRKGGDFKALIFEYMPNGSLDDWLHPKADQQNTNIKSLSLVPRLNLVLDVALALDYLHHQCETPVAHCDLKPSNVLLDNDMSARVGDFGLARFLYANISSSHGTYSSIGIKGSIGYIAPEYGMGGSVTTQGDVYSYGVLLLETFTGLRPTDGMFHSDLNLHKYVEMACPGRVLDIMDPSIVLNEEETSDHRERMHECMVSVFRVGLSCTQESITERMEMGDVIKELLRVKKILDGERPAGPIQSNIN